MPKNSLLDSLERIRLWLEREAPHIAASLQPGITPKKLKEILGTNAATHRVPEEVKTLYGWRNGQDAGLPLFGVLRFQPFQEAVDYGNLVATHFEGKLPLMIFRELGYDAGYQVRCDYHAHKQAPVYRWEHGDESIETATLTDLVAALAEGFEKGVFKPDAEGVFDTDENTWSEILVRHNSERTRNLNALIKHRWSELSGKNLREAFYDLVRIDPAQTAVLIRSCIEANPELDVQNFDGFYAIISCGISIGDTWTRDFALKLIASENTRVREISFLSLAWSWHGEIPFTEEVLNLLTQQTMSSQLNDHMNRERAMLLGKSGDRRSIPALLRLLQESAAEHASRDTRIAALNALALLKATQAMNIFLEIAQRDDDPGTRISAIRALIALGYEGANVEVAAKAHLRSMFAHLDYLLERETSPTLKRWIEEVKQSSPP